MARETTVGANSSKSALTGPALKRLFQIVAFIAGWTALLFACAGRLDWPRGWICVAAYLIAFASTAVLVIRKNPAVIPARAKMHRDAKGFDKLFTVVYAPLTFVVPAVAGLDAVRFGWSSIPNGTVWPGVILYLLAAVPIAWAMVTNPFLETQVRIQKDRGHRTVTTGPYRIVRHPMYVGVILQNISTPLVLGSLWTFVPAAAIIGLCVWRTALEDRTLRGELAGYADYAQQTRYRLLPGVW